MERNTPKPVLWIGSSLKDLRDFPEDVREEIGFALYNVQCGGMPPSAKPLKGYPGATVLEIREDSNTDTYRAVYTVRFAGFVYVLHAFQKKSKHGIATPQADLDLIRKRLLQAEQHYREWRRNQATGG